MLGLELPACPLAPAQRCAPCDMAVDRGGIHLLNCMRCARVTAARDFMQVRRQALSAGLTVTTTRHQGLPVEFVGGVARCFPDIALPT